MLSRARCWVSLVRVAGDLREESQISSKIITAAGIRYFANFNTGVLFSAGEFGCEPPLLLCG